MPKNKKNASITSPDEGFEPCQGYRSIKMHRSYGTHTVRCASYPMDFIRGYKMDGS
jgi:hypothetical protein